MSRFEFSLAGPTDDAQLRSRMAEDRMDGRISVSFRREPSYFAGTRLQGQDVQVIKCTDRANGEIVGLGARTRVRAFINGEASDVGYLADLRGSARIRKGTLLARGYRFLEELHRDNGHPLYLSVILDGNVSALTALVGGRAGLPRYQDWGLIKTPAIHLDFPRQPLSLPHVEFSRAAVGELPALLDFLNQEYARKQFAPVLEIQEFCPDGRFSDLLERDFFVARKNGNVVGCIAVWDQASIRQTHIERYSAGLAALRPWYNLTSHLVPGLKPLPAVGERIPYVYFCLVGAKSNDPGIFRALLRYTYNTCRTGPWHYAICSLHEQDPLHAVLEEYRHISAAGRLFVVSYPDDRDPISWVDKRPPYFDMALA
jgi:hypothetical protein